MDEKFSRRRGKGLLGCPILGEFPPCTIRNMCCVCASYVSQDAIICKRVGFSSTADT